MAKTTISAKIDPNRLARLDARVADLGITRTAAIEAAVDAWLGGEFTPITVRSHSMPLRTEPLPLVLDGEEPQDDPDQALLDLAAQPPSNPWGI